MAEDRMELYLSDAYPEGRGSGCLECRCELLNINRGHNPEILQRCRRLWEYSEFVSEIQKHLKEKKSLQESIQLAMDYCIDRDILRNILIKERTEVLHMLLTEYDEKEHMRALYREGREDGYAEGERAGFQKGEHAGFRKGEHAGFQKGEMAVLRNLIQIKLAKGKTPDVIADELEEDTDKVRQMIDDLRR